VGQEYDLEEYASNCHDRAERVPKAGDAAQGGNAGGGSLRGVPPCIARMRYTDLPYRNMMTEDMLCEQ
jgi:hypothetical protein